MIASRFPVVLRARAQGGFTLIELMVVVAVLFMLTAIALPMYRDYVKTAREGRIMNVVQGLTIFQQAYYVDSEPQSYFPGSYVPGGANGFAAIGYRVSGSSDSVAFTVSGGDSCGGDITRCYKVVARDVGGSDIGTYEAATGKWTWTAPP